jgi:hypothetical protein
MCSSVGLFFLCVVYPLCLQLFHRRVVSRMCCAYLELGCVCSHCLCVLFVSSPEISAFLSYVFKLAIFTFHLVDADFTIYVCCVVSRF